MMSVIRALRRAYRCHIAMDDVDRQLLYRIMNAQLANGIRVDDACKMISGRLTKMKPALIDLARLGEEAAAEGRPAMSAWKESDYLPIEDAGLLEVAENKGTLADTFTYLGKSERVRVSLFRSVVAPNIYQLVIFGIAVGIVFYVETIFGNFPNVGPGGVFPPALQLSAWLQANGAFVLGGLVASIIWISYGRSNWIGRQRAALLMFDEDWRHHLAMRFCHLAASLYENGASHGDVIDSTEQALASNRYTRRAVDAVRQEVITDGRSFAGSLSGRLLTPELAGCLEGMVPGEDPMQYPEALRTLSQVYQALLEQKYAVWQRSSNTALLVGTAGLIMLVAHGLFTVATQSLVFSQVAG